MNRIKIYITVATMMMGGMCSPASAQTENDNNVVVTTANGETEEIEVPELMMQNLDSLLAQYHAKTYLKPDADCNYRDENPTYAPEVYKERLQRLPTAFVMQYNDAVQQFIDRYTNRGRHSVSVMLGASNFYMPIFEQALEAYDLPLELKYLPVIESALNPNAVSRVGAAGLWQFMLKTGKDYGLKVNTLVDERRDPEKASYAAAHYLKDLYHIFGDWNLVLAAYNAGPAVVNKAIHRSGGEKDYWKLMPYLPKETRGYVPAFIAANYVMNYYCDHNICPMVTTLPVKTDTVMVTKDVRFEQIAEVLGLDAEALRAINPQYRRDVINGNTEPSSLRLPVDYVNKFVDNEEAIYTKKTEDSAAKVNGEAADVKAPEVSDDNNDEKAESEYNGRKNRKSHNYDEDNGRYSKKHKKDRDRKSKKDKKKKKKERSKEVEIRNGDTLSEIAERNHTTVKKLKKLNKISGDNIRAGKKLKVK